MQIFFNPVIITRRELLELYLVIFNCGEVTEYHTQHFNMSDHI